MKAADDFRMRIDDENEDTEADDRCRRRAPRPQVHPQKCGLRLGNVVASSVRRRVAPPLALATSVDG